MKPSTIGFEVPEDFPTQGYEKINAAMAPQKEALPQKWSEFTGAWNSVRIKFRALAQNDEIYTASIERSRGGASSFEERYNQEYALFNFFVVEDSLFESLFYGLYVIASTKNPAAFPITLQQIENVNPKMVQEKFHKYFKNEPITKYLEGILTSNEHKELKKIRNTLIHRTMPSRTIHLSTERAIPDIWMIGNIPTDEQLTASRRIWCSKVVSKLIDLMNDFILK